MLDRLVTQIEPPPDHTAKQELQVFHDFLSSHIIILLSDPGVGKTHLCQHAVRHEGAEYTTVRQFVVFDGEKGVC
jgi:chromosomal replication initiation ATPase DnaA